MRDRDGSARTRCTFMIPHDLGAAGSRRPNSGLNTVSEGARAPGRIPCTRLPLDDARHVTPLVTLRNAARSCTGVRLELPAAGRVRHHGQAAD